MEDNPVKISVVMPVCNADSFLEASINSILSQTYQNFELIIVCSSPTDKTRRILTKYKESDPRIIINYQEKKGIVFARNYGCQQAKGNYIAVMDADDISLPDRFESQVTFLEQHPDIGIVGSWAEYIDEKGIVFGRACPPINHLVIGWYLIFGNCMVHLTAMIRSDLLKNVGYYAPPKKSFQEDFAEDYDLWTRAFFLTKLANIPKPLGKYRVHKNNFTLTILSDQKRYCIPIQYFFIIQLLQEKDHFLLKELFTLGDSPGFSFDYRLNEVQVYLIETLYMSYVEEFSPSNSDIREIKNHISLKLLSYSRSMLHFSKRNSWNLLIRSFKYSKISLIKKIISVPYRELMQFIGFPPDIPESRWKNYR